MRILVVISGAYGQRHADHIRAYGLAEWQVSVWQAPTVLPPVIDYPDEYLPDTMPAADLILSVAEHRGVAELLPDMARLTGARAVIAAVDNEAWLPRGLARQLCGWLGDMGVACVTPKPLCSLTESDYGAGRGRRVAYNDPLIRGFAHHLGQPALRLTVDPQTRHIVAAEVVRDTVCGCARYVAQGLVGVAVDEAEERAGLLHHHYPCQASMGIDLDYGDTLMHVSGHLMRDDVAAQVKPFKPTRYLSPDRRAGEDAAG